MKMLIASLFCIVSNSGFSVTDRNLPDAQSNLGLWGDGKGEDELSPEEIQMASMHLVSLSILLCFLLCSYVLRKFRFTQVHLQLSCNAEQCHDKVHVLYTHSWFF